AHPDDLGRGRVVGQQLGENVRQGEKPDGPDHHQYGQARRGGRSHADENRRGLAVGSRPGGDGTAAHVQLAQSAASTLMVSPLTKRASSLSRNRTTAATSSGLIQARPMGVASL